MFAKGKKKAAPGAKSPGMEDINAEAITRQNKMSEVQDRAFLEGMEWLDDIMEGFAEIFRITQAGVNSCSMCVGSTVYPMKEYLIGKGAKRRESASNEAAVDQGATFDMDH